MSDKLVWPFMELFTGRADAYGTGEGRVIRAYPSPLQFGQHLAGEGPGLGIFPLRDDGTVRFGAVDLDAPDFKTARAIQELLPGTTWIERSRSGNAHVWAFFSDDAPAWMVRGIMLVTLRSLGLERVEVFPKQDALLPGMVGNYINLPYHGDERPILYPPTTGSSAVWPVSSDAKELDDFVREALESRNDPADWQRRADYLQIERPGDRTTRDREFGTNPVLHECALHILNGARTGERPVREGHRSVVYFSLAKQLLDWEGMDEDMAWELVEEVNELSPDPLPRRELSRIFNNAAGGRFTSTGCDDPLMAPYVSPTCPIAGH